MEIGHVHAARMMDPENIGKEAILKVTDWLRGIWEMRRRAGPVQQWVDSIPLPAKPATDDHLASEENPTPPLTPVSTKDSRFVNSNMAILSSVSVPGSPVITMTGTPSPIPHNRLARDPSFQSDSSHCSSVESLLELRRADPEAILLGLGFGGCTNSFQENGPLSRIPKRFLQPSKLKGIAINDFIKHQQETSESLDSTSLGYRGLTGSPYVAPSEIVQKIMERLREHESHEQDAYTVYNNNTEPYSPIFQDTSRLSVLSPDNRQFLERPRSKSPDMRNKRMIIGQKSFAFGCDGDLIEIKPLSHEQEPQHTSTNGNVDNHSIELEETSVANEPMLGLALESSYINKVKEAKSAISNGRQDKRLVKQLSIDDSAQDFVLPDGNSLPDDECYSRSCENSVGSSSLEVSQIIDGSEHNDQWRVRRENNADDQTLSKGRRRASDGFSDTRMLWARLLREGGRRFSDGVMRSTSGLLNRRRSLNRQARISDAESLQYCDSDSCSDLVVSEEVEQPECSLEREFPVGVPEATKIEANETEGINHRSDRLSKHDMESPCESPTEINGNANVDGESSRTKRIKNRSGLAVIRDMHTSVRSIRMEPGF